MPSSVLLTEQSRTVHVSELDLTLALYSPPLTRRNGKGTAGAEV